MRVVEAELSLV